MKKLNEKVVELENVNNVENGEEVYTNENGTVTVKHKLLDNPKAKKIVKGILVALGIGAVGGICYKAGKKSNTSNDTVDECLYIEDSTTDTSENENL